MAGHTDKYAKYVFCKYLEDKGYKDIKIINTPVDISARLGNETWWFELKKTSKTDKCFGATTLTELEKAQEHLAYFRFVIAQSENNDEKCTSFIFYELSLEQMIAYGRMSIPPFKVYFNLPFDKTTKKSIESQCYKHSCLFSEKEYEKYQSHGKRDSESIDFKLDHINELLRYQQELKCSDINNEKKCFYRVDKRECKINDSIEATGEYFSALDNKRTTIEYLLENYRPERLISRQEALFVFNDIKDAVMFCSKIQGSYVYLVQPIYTNNMHRADMNIVELLYKLQNQDEKITWAKNYWNGESIIGSPCYEYLFYSAKVIKRLLSHDECKTMCQDQTLMYKRIACVL